MHPDEIFGPSDPQTESDWAPYRLQLTFYQQIAARVAAQRDAAAKAAT